MDATSLKFDLALGSCEGYVNRPDLTTHHRVNATASPNHSVINC